MNLVARPSSSSSSAFAPSNCFTPGTLPGCQWRHVQLLVKNRPRRHGGVLLSSVSPVVSKRGGGGHSASASSFAVNAFFGGNSKTPPVKSAGKGCFNCLGKGAVDCAGCKGSGKNKKNGNMFERWKCYDCQGFGMIACPKCGKGGLTPEQRGER